MLTVLLVLVIAAFIATVASAMGHCPLWVPVILLCLYGLIEQLPIGKS